MRDEVLRIDPTALPGYTAFMAEADLCYELGFEDLGCKPFVHMGDLFQALPSMVRMKGWRSLHAMVATHIKHPKLRQALSLQALLIGGNPFQTCVFSSSMRLRDDLECTGPWAVRELWSTAWWI